MCYTLGMKHWNNSHKDKGGSFLFSGLLMIGLGIVFCISFPALADEINPDKIDETKGDIKDLEKKIDKVTKEKTSLSQNLQAIDGSLTATQRAIQETKTHIETTQETISRKEGEIAQLEVKLGQQKKVLQDMVQLMYDTSQTPLSEVVFHEGSMSQILDGSDQVLTLQERIGMLIDESSKTKENIKKEREDLDNIKKEKEQLLVVQNSQKNNLLGAKQETQSDIAEKDATIEELQKKLAELESDLNILTGKSFNAKDIREAVNFASDETGVPEGVLYGFLKMETNLGANTGQCTYKEVEKVAVARYKKYGTKYQSSINLLYKRRDIFYEIVKTLGYSKDKKVSCSPSGYIGQGGAMGVSQFMSDVWKGYEASVRSKTGHSKPDPWSLTDGVMAMALKLQKAGATSSKESVIKSASINYLGGFNTSYYNGIVYWSKNYKKLFE